MAGKTSDFSASTVPTSNTSMEPPAFTESVSLPNTPANITPSLVSQPLPDSKAINTIVPSVVHSSQTLNSEQGQTIEFTKGTAIIVVDSMVVEAPVEEEKTVLVLSADGILHEVLSQRQESQSVWVEGAIMAVEGEAAVYTTGASHEEPDPSLEDTGRVDLSRLVFDEMPERDNFAWAATVSAHAKAGELGAARSLFDEMPEKITPAWNAMVNGYARTGDVESAELLFKEMSRKDLISWTTMINCYSQNGIYGRAIEVFCDMKSNLITPDEVTMTSVISACAHLGVLDQGQEMHLYVMQKGFDLGVHIGSALIDMYAKCGSLERSLLVFYKLREKNLFCWNSVIDGLAVHGYAEEALAMFSRMEKEKVMPNGVTFVSVLTACTHAGLVEEGRKRFLTMTGYYGIVPEMEHYGCMVDLLCKAGLPEEALEIIRSMRMEPNAVVWGALLGGCKLQKNLEIAQFAVGKLSILEPKNSGYYALLVNMYADANRWSEVARIRAILRELGVEKECPGSSWIEIEKKIHQFAACDNYHHSSQEIYSLLDGLDGQLKLAANVQELGFVKLIGARFYDDPGDSPTPVTGTPRDHDGHGTHVAATAAGSPVADASYYGLAAGTAKGGSPGSRIAVYRICTPYGCSGSAIMKAFDYALADGVDIINLSIGQPAGAEFEFSKNPIAIGAFHAVEKGILVVASAGNDGPLRETVVNVVPWIFTVAATTIDRNIETHIPLGRNKLIKGGGISFGNLSKSPVYPLPASESANLTIYDGVAGECEPDSLDEHKVKGKIVVCEYHVDDYSIEDRLNEVKNKGGIGFILVIPDDELTHSGTQTRILSRCSNHSRGWHKIHQLNKPDIVAPGTAILAAWPANDTEVSLSGQEPPLFNILSGTSLSCPHVSAIAATLKSQNPTWSPSAIRSAIMTTAFQESNLKSAMLINSAYGKYLATPYDFVEGVATMSGPLKPGLVYETEITDYLQFLCSTGYNISTIKLISNTLPNNFSCPTNSSAESVSNMNYPSIAVSISTEEETRPEL
ncbi:pentatricopeptide repeat-containing protein [Nicotiana attenuata]|uniref:Pentatricopeptide repeat-containing protein n=1 Tax=Nicotiana attenuata TaxID=49451 RepID=A0A1J6IZK6_NICAT|nr:pentatricopeptide repeat-containing protein [Nicotiana attenuata]